MTRPVLTVQVAFATSPLIDTPIWESVTGAVERLSYRRGRQRELDRFETGTATIDLTNQGNTFDPSHSLSAFYGSLRPGKRIRVRATFLGSTYDLYTGFITNIVSDWIIPGGRSVARIDAMDGLGVFALRRIDEEAFSTDTSGNVIDAILDHIAWPPADRAIDTGAASIQSLDFPLGTQSPVLPVLQTIAQSEGGQIFVNGAGQVVFNDRTWRASSTTNTVTLGTSSYGVQASPIVYDDTDIRNDISVTRTGGTAQTAYDAGSETAYFRRYYSISGLYNTTDLDTQGMANFMLSKYKDPRVRVKEVYINGDTSDLLWPFLITLDLDTRIGVARPRPPSDEIQAVFGSGTPTSGAFTITVSGSTTSALPYNATAAQVCSALEALPNVGAGNVLCDQGPLPTLIRIIWINARGGQNLSNISVTSSVSPGSIQAAGSTTDGGQNTTYTQDSFIDHLDVRIDKDAWLVRYTLTPVELYTSFILNDTVYGLLNGTNNPLG